MLVPPCQEGRAYADGPDNLNCRINWVNTVYREAMLGVDFDTFKASYQKWFGIDLPTPKVGFPQEFA